MTKKVREVRLAGTILSVWFAHSSSGLAAGPYAEQAQADRRANGSIGIEELAVSTIVPTGSAFPEEAVCVGVSASSKHASLWCMTLHDELKCCFVLFWGRPLPFTARSVETVEANLTKFLGRARMWSD